MSVRDPLRLWRVVDGLAVCLKYLMVYPLIAPRRTVRFLWTLGHQIRAYGHSESGAKITPRTLETIFPGIEQVEVALADVSWRDGNVDVKELYALCAMARHRTIRCALEIGTFEGLVMAQLARNTDPQARLITLDLRPEDLARLRSPLAPGEALYVRKAAIGEKLTRLPEDLRGRVTQLYGDSMQLDFSPYYGQVDLVFIDGSHQLDYVAHDTEEAFRLRSPGGVVVWHDYLVWPDVTRHLNALRTQHALVQIEGTSLVVSAPR